MQETQVWSLGWDDPLEEEMATHSNILAWEIPWAEEPGGLQSRELQIVGQDLVTEHARMAWSEASPGNSWTCAGMWNEDRLVRTVSLGFVV